MQPGDKTHEQVAAPAPASTRQPGPDARGDRRKSLAGMPYDQQAAALRPDCQPPTSQTLRDRRTEVEGKVRNWATDSLTAITMIRERSRGAVGRFVHFVADHGSGAFKRLAGDTIALYSVLGGGGKVSCFVAGVLADAVGDRIGAAEPSLAAYVAALDAQEMIARDGVLAQRGAWEKRLEEATSPEAIAAVLGEVQSQKTPKIPGENQIYGELQRRLAESNGMLVRSTIWPEVYGKHYLSRNIENPFGLDGQDVAGELNNLARDDPSTRVPFSTY